MYSGSRRRSMIPWLASVLLLLALSCGGRETEAEGITAGEIGFLVFTGVISIVVLVLAVGLVLTLLGAVLYFFVRRPRTSVSESGPGHTAWNIGLIAASIALFGILISGVFVFMALQIHTTAERAAERSGEKVAGEVAAAAARERMEDLKPELRGEARKAGLAAIGDLVADAPTVGESRTVDETHTPGSPAAGSAAQSACADTTYRPTSDEAEQEAGEPRETTTCESLGVASILVGPEHTVTLEEFETKRVCFDVDQKANYRIEAISTTDGDPAVALYGSRGGLVHFDDDGGDGLNSCFEIELRPDAYLLEVDLLLDVDRFGQAATHTVSVKLTTVNSGG